MSSEALRNSTGSLIGTIDTEGRKQVLRDRNGARLGEYDADQNVTRDQTGRKVGTGNLLLTLLK